MAEAINHNIASEAATGAGGVVKGALKGLAAVPLAGAVIGAGLGIAIGIATGGFGLAAIGYGALIGGSIGGIGGGVASFLGAGPIAAIGGFLGLSSSARQVSQEKAAYLQASNQHAQQRQGAQTQVMQQGYQMGFQQGQAYAVNQIQSELQAQMVQEQQRQAQMQQEQLPSDGFAAKEMARRGHGPQQHGSHAEMVASQKEQAANAEHEI